ncbi:TonB-dependent receptor [Croceibacterium ferulae]|uniref:TonB-dependent receptor n=1 Tax=Croceibacterium ferulae TaxID=1854641 RepID=UPI001F4E589C|nr:TonB-dependent receptor [Croceibacterium ferulae]
MLALSTGIIAAPAMAQQTGSPTNPQPGSETETSGQGVGALPTGLPAANGPEDEIVVTGVRASLEAAAAIKRNSVGVVDAISAEDIGKFPDTNLAESLQRIPGVSIDRRNGEGSQVTVRGFGPSFNLVTINGRQLATTDVNTVGGDASVDFGRATSRSFDFQNLASEGVTRLEVYKTGRAAVPTGGIGASINVVTQRPLEGAAEGLRGSIGGKGLYDASRDGFSVTPEVTGVISWSNPEDTFGVSAFGAYQKRKSAAASAVVNGWNIRPYSDVATIVRGGDNPTVVENAPTDPSQLVGIPDDSRYNYSTFERERINGSLTMQFRPVDGLTITGDALYAQNAVSEARNDQTNWFNTPFDRVVFDDDPVVRTAVILEEGSRYATKDMGFEQQYRATKSELQSYGLNATYELADGLTLSLDGNHSKSETNPDAPNGASSTLFSMGAPVVDGHSADHTGDIPAQRYTLNDINGNNNGVLDIGDLGSQVARTNASRQEQRVNQLRADLGWDFGDGDRFDVGATYIDAKMISERQQTEQILGNWGITQAGDIAAFGGDLVEQFCQGCKYSKFNATDNNISFRGNAVDLLNIFSPIYAQDNQPLVDGIQAPTDTNQQRVTANQYDEVSEKILAVYAQTTLNFDIGGRDAKITAGVRWENTKVESVAQQAIPAAIIWTSDNDFTVRVSDELQDIVADGEYNNLLPSIDFQLEPMDDVVARVSYSRTLARPDYGNLFASTTAGAPGRPIALDGQATGGTGNPGLRPLLSDNIDVSLEWYYDRSSYVSFGFFAKKVNNFVGSGTVVQPLFGLRDPTSGAPGTRSGAALAELQALGRDASEVELFTLTALIDQNGGNVAAASAEFQANIVNGNLDQAYADSILAQFDVTANADDPLFQFQTTTPINNESANIYGFEVQGQHFFGDSGFGVSASYTNVNGDVGADRGAPIGVDQFALIGLSDTLNVTGIFEKYGFSGRLAYNWRDSFLSGLNRGGTNRNPVFTKAFGTLDLATSYDITPTVSVSFEAINLLSATVRTYGRSERQMFFASELKPRYFVGARFRF